MDIVVAAVERCERQDNAIGCAADLLGVMITLVCCKMTGGVLADEYASNEPLTVLYDPATVSILANGKAC
ncbi:MULTISPECIES: hypothetical protein [unclassified Rhizobium]|uniref:hypothetical protein n=1 Tax=unclassified Rhizobium TaxID=2613769 RepID=UPI001612EFAD|nr:hypothetical protein [Rhizobium sp. BK399]MCS3741167.1 hypothetical protein [Rhizobium sp. BK661]MCS4093331.1 hypothetical protein [Rhizobium sp. BK176]